MFMGGDGKIINTLYRMWETLLETRDLEGGVGGDALRHYLSRQCECV